MSNDDNGKPLRIFGLFRLPQTELSISGDAALALVLAPFLRPMAATIYPLQKVQIRNFRVLYLETAADVLDDHSPRRVVHLLDPNIADNVPAVSDLIPAGHRVLDAAFQSSLSVASRLGEHLHHDCVVTVSADDHGHLAAGGNLFYSGKVEIHFVVLQNQARFWKKGVIRVNKGTGYFLDSTGKKVNGCRNLSSKMLQVCHKFSNFHRFIIQVIWF